MAKAAHSARPKNSSWQSSKVLPIAEELSNFPAWTPLSKMYAGLSSTESVGRNAYVLIPQLESDSTLPNPKWAVCTSATRKYATSALDAAGIKIPDVFVAAEDVKQGKPA